MKYIILLALLCTSVSASVSFSLGSVSGYPGQSVNVPLSLSNDVAIWGFSFKVSESPLSNINFVSGSAGNRLANGLNGVSVNSPDVVTAYSVFAGNTPGIIIGNDVIYTLSYNIPSGLSEGVYSLSISDVFVSDSSGAQVNGVSVSGGSISVTEEPDAMVVLPSFSLLVNEQKEFFVCLSNDYPDRAIKTLSLSFGFTSSILEVVSVDILQGVGTSDIDAGSVEIELSGLNVEESDCSESSGANVAKVKVRGKIVGSTPLTIVGLSATDDLSQPFAVQALSGSNGHASVGSSASSSGSGGGGGGGGNSKSSSCPVYCNNREKYGHVDICKSAICTVGLTSSVGVPETVSEVPFANKPVVEKSEPVVVEREVPVVSEEVSTPVKSLAGKSTERIVTVDSPVLVEEDGIYLWNMALLLVLLAGLAAFVWFLVLKKKKPVEFSVPEVKSHDHEAEVPRVEKVEKPVSSVPSKYEHIIRKKLKK